MTAPGDIPHHAPPYPTGVGLRDYVDVRLADLNARLDALDRARQRAVDTATGLMEARLDGFPSTYLTREAADAAAVLMDARLNQLRTDLSELQAWRRETQATLVERTAHSSSGRGWVFLWVGGAIAFVNAAIILTVDVLLH